MCGISGIMSPSGAEEAQLRRSIEALAHRGPDDAGSWVDVRQGIAFAHARLAILDLSAAGHQPMQSRSGRYMLTFNGEIYNHVQLRAELQRSVDLGWRGRSDTETILAGFEAWGVEGTIKRAVGMFAFGVWDNRESALTLGRDRLGEKPLYYGQRGKSFIFASELRALTAYQAFEPKVDRDSLAAYLRLGYVPAPQSVYEGIFKLPPGTLLTVRPGTGAPGRPVPYWSLLDVAQQGLDNPFIGSDDDAVNELERRLNEAIALQRVADVPLGVFLSGGVDSSLVAVLMQAQSRTPVKTFTIGFDDGLYDESVHARAVARQLGTEHTEMRLSSEDALAVVSRLPEIYDEPFAAP
ncbi:MAG: asparagine synthase (glutamine-hydrolyzing), partial [Gemmatimonadetes bacterium]|nr:asparagine synthase (glutamine-hydrolyzing) [Gemmatimonadota bacterium]